VLSIKSFLVFGDVGIEDKKNNNGRLGLNLLPREFAIFLHCPLLLFL
jgi:hypothetical protein